MNNHATSPRRLHSLDALRGVAALAVVFWHWQHFFFSGTALAAGFNKEAQPFYEVFKIFYQHGALGVYLFFSLSGFIFFWLYATTISTRRLTPSEFFVLRVLAAVPLALGDSTAGCDWTDGVCGNQRG
jgi:peptidoglycan/LPS O-acetylase OafA/YrhL